MNTVALESTPTRPSFGGILREWRKARGSSQLDLALLCRMSQKHLSFLESGRSRPSRGMILHLASALAVPLRQQNAMLLAAGFAPLYKERSLEAPDMRPVDLAFAYVLEQQEPFPALVVDRAYHILRANRAMGALLTLLTGSPDALATGQPMSVVELVLQPHGLRPFIENWDEVAAWLLRRLRGEAVLEGAGHKSAAALLEKLRSIPGVDEVEKSAGVEQDFPPTLITRFRKGDTRLALFSLIASLGTPLDVTLQTLHVELFFPADEATGRWFRQAQATQQ